MEELIPKHNEGRNAVKYKNLMVERPWLILWDRHQSWGWGYSGWLKSLSVEIKQGADEREVGSPLTWDSSVSLMIAKPNTAKSLTSQGGHLSHSSCFPASSFACFCNIILRWAWEKCPPNEGTSPNNWLSCSWDDSWGADSREGGTHRLLCTHSTSRSAVPSFPSGRRSVTVHWKPGQAPALLQLYYSILGKHLETKQCLWPVMCVIPWKLELLDKSQWAVYINHDYKPIVSYKLVWK